MRLTLAKIGWIACIPALGVLSVSAMNHKRAAVVTEYNVEIERFDAGAYFLTEDDLLNELTKIVGDGEHHISDLHSDEIEAELEENPFIEKADVYVSSDGELSLRVEQKEPMARVFDAEGKSFYIDTDGDVIPLSPSFSAHVTTLTGHIKPETDVEKKGYDEWTALVGFIHTINEDDFMRAMVEQIDVDRKRDIVIVPKVGNARIHFGSLENTEIKIDNLKAFYKEVMAVDGWNKYKSIDLSYDGQIVCQKAKTDS
jgi:cell division protein FtsQ